MNTIYCTAVAVLFGQGPPPMLLQDEFRRDSRNDYFIIGKPAWRAGALDLSPGSSVGRPIPSANPVCLTVRLHFAGKGKDAELRAWLWTKGKRALGALRRQGGEVTLHNHSGSAHTVRLGPAKSAGWSLRLEVWYGLVRLKAWPDGAPEPTGWHSQRLLGDLSWVPGGLGLDAHGGDVTLTSWALTGTARARATKEQQEQFRNILPAMEAPRLSKEGRAGEGLARVEQALALIRKGPRPWFELVSGSLHALAADCLLKLGRPADASARFADALRSLDQLLPPQHPLRGDLLLSAGKLLRDQGRPAEARGPLAEALVCRRATLPPDHLDVALAAAELGATLRLLGVLDEGRLLLEESLAVRRKVLPPTSPDIALALANLGDLLHAQREHDKAGACFDEAVALLKRASPSPPAKARAVVLTALGRDQLHRKRPEAAAAYFAEALTVLDRNGEPDDLVLAGALWELGRLRLHAGRYEEARAPLERALAIGRKLLPPSHPELIRGGVNMSQALQRLGQHALALARLEEALATHRQGPAPDRRISARLCHNVATALKHLGRHAEALKRFEEALELYRGALPEDHPEVAETLTNMSAALNELGRFAEAHTHMERAVAALRKAPPASRLVLADALQNLGSTLSRLDRLDEARAATEESLRLCRELLPPEDPRLTLRLNNLGAIHTRKGDRERAWAFYREAHDVEAAFVARAADLLPQSEHAASLRLRDTVRHNLLQLALRWPDLPRGKARDLLGCLLDSKAVSAAAVGRRRLAALAGGDAEALTLYHRLGAARQRLADLLLRPPEGSPQAEWRKACAEAQRRVAELEQELARRVRGYTQERLRSRATPNEVASRLAEGEVLVELVRHGGWGPPGYAAVLLGRGQAGAASPVQLVDLGAAAPLERAVAAWRQQVQRGQTATHDLKDEPKLLADIRKGDVVKAPALALRALLWEPLAKALPPKTERLVIAPDGALALVPFEALLLADGKYLVEGMKISYVSTGRDLMPLPQPREKSDVALLLADPVYDAAGKVEGGKGMPASVDLPKGLRFRSLPGFAREAAAVAHLLKGQRGWNIDARRGEEASEEALAKASRPRLLYCITHGFFLQDVERKPPGDRLRDLDFVAAGSGRVRLPNFGPDPRLRSGLALAGANQWQERSAKGLSDGLLTALEVESLDLWGTELVVLSACETGLGEVQNGEGVLGLRRAFQLAGAQTVVASLWKVPDAETEQLMTDFLGHWLKGQGKAEALRQAQLDLIRTLRASPSAARREASPLYWAGFICHGQAK